MGLDLGSGSSFTFLRKDDFLPSVTTSQVLLRRHRPGAKITCDGNYGAKTKAAVEAYQGSDLLKRDGKVGPNTWNNLLFVSGFQAVDIVDGTDPSLIAFEASDIRKAGGDRSSYLGNPMAWRA